MMKLVGYPGMEESFLLWGYSKNFMLGVGAFELLLSIAIYVKATRVYALLTLLVFMTAAIYTHLSNGEYDQINTAIFLVILSTICLWFIWLLDRATNFDRTSK